jgi:glutamyl-tRNA synthetase
MSEDKANNCYRGRLAPTPSGFLHKGHIQTFRKAWERARDVQGSLVLRIDDLDSARCTSEYNDACIQDMKEMGLEWDEGPDVGGSHGPYAQSKRGSFYFDALKKLYKLDLIYPCQKSRKEIQTYGLLDSMGSEYLFPESFRPNSVDLDKIDFPGNTNWRFRTNWGQRVEFMDRKKAEQSFLLGADLSDFLVWRKDGVASYELATVVDDYVMKITEVVRGEDLLLSSARQYLLFDALGWSRPDFYHCGLLLGEDGKKLSKSTRSLPRLFSHS